MGNRQAHLSRHAAPQPIDEGHVLDPPHEVHAHAVQQPRVAALGGGADVQLVQVARALISRHTALNLAGLGQADVADGLESGVNGVWWGVFAG